MVYFDGTTDCTFEKLNSTFYRFTLFFIIFCDLLFHSVIVLIVVVRVFCAFRGYHLAAGLS